MFMDATAYATGHDDLELRHRQSEFQQWLASQITVRYYMNRTQDFQLPIPEEFNDSRIYEPVLALCRSANWRARTEPDAERDGDARFVVLDCGRVPVSPVKL